MLQQALVERTFECDPNMQITSKFKGKIEAATLPYLDIRTRRMIKQKQPNPIFNQFKL